MAAQKLTAKAVENAKPGANRREIPDGGQPGLYLIVQPSGRKSWAARYRWHGEARKETLGRFPAVELGEARDKARAVVRMVERGEDPRAAREAEKAEQAAARVDTYAAAVEDFIQKWSIAKKKNRSWKEQRRLLLTAAPAWHDRPITDISRRDVHAVLDRMVADGKPILANRTHAILCTFFRWAYSRDRVPENFMEKVEKPYDEGKPNPRAWTDDELRAIWQATGDFGQPFGDYLKVLVLLGQRRDEVAGMRWDELDLDAATWTLPAARGKSKRDSLFPLPALAVRILRSMPRHVGSPFVFPGAGTRSGEPCPLTIGSKRQQQVQAASGVTDFKFHDARRTFRTGLDRLGIPPHVKDECLNHARRGVGDVHYSAYDYLAEQRQAFDAWADHVQSVTSPQGVVPLHG
jgi:integrase